jgi:hypothetical protein
MANVNEDVIRHEDTTANLPTSSRNGQVTFETDSNKRMRHALLSGEGHFWTPDDKLTAAIPSYTNGSFPTLATVKDALDYLLAHATLS